MKNNKNLLSLSLILIFILLLTACGNKENDININSDLLDKDNNTKSKIGPMGKYVQTDISLQDITNAEAINFTQGENGDYLLSVYDNDTHSPRAFSYQDGDWTEKKNEHVIEFLTDKNITNLKAFSDFEDNWWVFYNEDNLVKGCQILKDGSVRNIDLPFSDSPIGKCLIGDTDIITIDIGLGGSSSTLFLIDTKTGKIIENKIPAPESFYGFQVLNNKYITSHKNKINSYDILTGEIIDSYDIIASNDNFGSTLTTSFKGSLYIINDNGIQTMDKNSETIESIVYDAGYAFADPNLTSFIDSTLLVDDSNISFMFLTFIQNKLKIFEYHFDKDVSANKENSMTVWAFTETPFIQAAISVFSKTYPDYEIILEIGMEKFVPPTLPTLDGLAQMDKYILDNVTLREDAIKKLNVKLITGDVPDVLFLDGLSVETLYNKGFLSNINLEIDETQYHEKILKTYTKGDKTYAYPASFMMPTLVSDGTLPDITLQNNSNKITELYQNPDNIESFLDYWSLFNTYFYASYHEIFPDYKNIEEDSLKEFLHLTKKIADASGKFQDFRWSETSSTASILFNISEASYLFLTHEKLEILPLLKGTIINCNVVSIPADAKNKEIAKNFIQLILDDEVQEVEKDFFSVKKDVQLKYFEANNVDDFDPPNETTTEYNDNSITSFIAFDWNKLINSYSNSVERDYLMEGIIFEQAVKLYEDEISIDTAVSECMKKIQIIIAERK